MNGAMPVPCAIRSSGEVSEPCRESTLYRVLKVHLTLLPILAGFVRKEEQWPEEVESFSVKRSRGRMKSIEE